MADKVLFSRVDISVHIIEVRRHVDMHVYAGMQMIVRTADDELTPGIIPGLYFLTFSVDYTITNIPEEMVEEGEAPEDILEGWRDDLED